MTSENKKDARDEHILMPDNEEMRAMMAGSISEYLLSKDYSEPLVKGWVNGICESMMDKLMDRHLPFKVVLNVSIAHRNRNSIHCASSCNWSQADDKFFHVLWSNQTMHVIFTVHCAKI